jgi:hypothetical protein
MWWTTIIVVALLAFGIVGFVSMVRLFAQRLTGETTRGAEDMYDQYADSPRERHRRSLAHAATAPVLPNRVPNSPLRFAARSWGLASGDVTEAGRAVTASGQRQPRRPHHRRRAAAGRAARHRAARRPGRPHPARRGLGPRCRLPRPARGPAPAAWSPARDRPAAPPARPSRRHSAGLRPRGHHGRRPENLGRPGPCPQDRRGYRRARHHPGRRRAWHHRHRGPGR